MMKGVQKDSSASIGRDSFFKRGLDISVLTVSHILLFPVWCILWVLIPLAIWIEDGIPIFYRQKRIGKNGEIFTVLKFRSMFSHADKIIRPWQVPDNKFVTRVGRILRATALDELPQVLSIAKGDMSFVGPRAMPFNEFEEFVQKIPQLKLRLSVRPGLTGLAQVYGNATRDVKKKLKYDMLYIRRQSVCLDVKLLLMSLWITFRGKWESRENMPQERLRSKTRGSSQEAGVRVREGASESG